MKHCARGSAASPKLRREHHEKEPAPQQRGLQLGQRRCWKLTKELLESLVYSHHEPCLQAGQVKLWFTERYGELPLFGYAKLSDLLTGMFPTGCGNVLVCREGSAFNLYKYHWTPSQSLKRKRDEHQRPCRFFSTPKGCKDGHCCRFAHEHPRSVKF